MFKMISSLLAIVVLLVSVQAATAGDNAKKKEGKDAAAAAKKEGKKAAAKKEGKKEGKKAAKKGQRAAGQVTSIDANAGKVTITTGKKDAKVEKSYKIAADCKVKIMGEDKAVADVQVGKRAMLVLSEDGQTVTAINVGGKKKQQ